MPVLVPHAALAGLLGEESIQSEAATVGELFEEVRRRVSPERWKEAQKVAILVNGRNIHYIQGFKTRLAPADQVWMVVASAGG